MGEPRTAASVQVCSRLTTRTSMGWVPRLRRVQSTHAGPRTPKSLGYPADQFSDDSLLPPICRSESPAAISSSPPPQRPAASRQAVLLEARGGAGWRRAARRARLRVIYVSRWGLGCNAGIVLEADPPIRGCPEDCWAKKCATDNVATTIIR